MTRESTRQYQVCSMTAPNKAGARLRFAGWEGPFFRETPMHFSGGGLADPPLALIQFRWLDAWQPWWEGPSAARLLQLWGVLSNADAFFGA